MPAPLSGLSARVGTVIGGPIMHVDARSVSNLLAAARLVAVLSFAVGATSLFSEAGFAQVGFAQHHNHILFAQQQTRVAQRRAATTFTPPQQAPATTATLATPPVIDKTSVLGQAVAACNQNEADQETFVLPGPKGEITLDRCYKGRAHLLCVFNALSTEASALTKSYTKIVEAKYPELTSVEGICKISPETLATDIAGSEDFAKRFKELKSQYDAAAKCAAAVEQTFKDISLADMAQASEVLQSMTASIDSDVAKISKVQEKIADLSSKMDLSNRAMRQVTKVHHAICMKANAGERPGN
jgi:hypothetical protein